MTTSVAITSFATWTPGGVSVREAPRLEGIGSALGAWPDAPRIETIHARARKPSGAARALVQIAHGVLSSRRGASNLDPARIAICVGSETGCAVADSEFADGLERRGEGFGSPSIFVYTLPTAVLGEVSIALGLRSEIVSVSAGRASGLTAVAIAADGVASGRFAACLCGGVEIGTVGAHRVFGPDGRDSVALFLLEPVDPTGVCALRDWSTGFDPGRTASGAVGTYGANAPLLELAAAAVRPGEGLLACTASEGFHATLGYAHGA